MAMRARRSSTLEPPHLRTAKSSHSLATTTYRSAKSSLSPSDFDGDVTINASTMRGEESFVSALQGDEDERGYYDEDDYYGGRGEDHEEGGDELAYLQSNSSYLDEEMPTPQQPHFFAPPSPSTLPPHSDSISSSLNDGGSGSSTEDSIISSTESTTFGLNSPFPRQQVLKLESSDRTLRSQLKGKGKAEPNNEGLGGTDKENAPLPLRHEETDPDGPRRQQQHVRVRAHPSTQGFPYVGSLIAASVGSPSWSPPSPSPEHQLDVDSAPTRSTSNEKEVATAITMPKSQRSSSEVDLDISFDMSPASSGPRKHTRRRSLSSLSTSSSSGNASSSSSSSAVNSQREFTSIDMQAAYAHLDQVGELVRSPSGRLTGTRKRVRSAIELREAYMQGERELQLGGRGKEVALAILMDEEGGNGWVRGEEAQRNSRETVRHAKMEKEKEKDRNSLGAGFAFNPTKALEVPLPDSPATGTTWSDNGPSRSSIGSKKFPLPLRIVDSNHHQRTTSPTMTNSPSPAWSITSFFRNRDNRDSHTPPTSQFDDHSPSPPQTASTAGPGESWTKKSMSYLGLRRSPLSQSPTTPVFNTGEVLVGQMDAYAAEYEKEQGEKLHGLGFDFGPAAGEEVARVDLTTSTRTARPIKKHQTIPSLSISPPRNEDEGDERHEEVLPEEEEEFDVADDEDDYSENEDEDDPTTSPSRRLSRSLSPVSVQSHSTSSHTHRDGRTSVTFPTLSPPRRPNFGAPPRNLLYSETMPGKGKLPHQAKLDSTRFSFKPAPLSLVEEHAHAHAHATATQPSTIDRSRRRKSRLSISSFTEILLAYPSSIYIDNIPPARLLFTLGFFLGPWCWLLGGWLLRPSDGEMIHSHGKRCRKELNRHCGCGDMVGWVNASVKRRHGDFVSEEELGDVDGWVRWNRRAAGVSGGVVGVVFVVAIWAAASA